MRERGHEQQVDRVFLADDDARDLGLGLVAQRRQVEVRRLCCE